MAVTPEEKSRILKQVTYVSASVNFVLILIKLITGLTFHSLSLVSDAIHSASDLITDFVVLIGHKASKKPADDDHHYGHGKYETISQIILAGFILFAASGILFYSIQSILEEGENPKGIPVFVVAFISFLANEGLFTWSRKKALYIHSKLLLANAWHHRSDGLSSLVVVLGAIFIMLDIKYADAVVGIVVSALVGYAGLDILKKSFRELSESSPGEKYESKVKEIINNNKDVLEFHNLRLRSMGSSVFMDMHILVEQTLTLIEAHDIAEDLEREIKEGFDEHMNVLVHVEPYEEDHTDL